MRLLLTLLAFVVALVPTAVAMFFAVLFLAGPHGGVMPTALHGATLVACWIVVIVVPLLVARWAWRRYPSRPAP